MRGFALKIKNIFGKYWETFIKEYAVRDSVYSSVSRFLKCGDYRYGFISFKCSNCGNEVLRPFSCKSRFCPGCSKVYKDNRIEHFNSIRLNVPHRHIVFTIPEEFRRYFYKDRSLLGILFSASSETILSLGRYGIMSVIHTYGRDLKWNPHIHMLVTEYRLQKGKLVYSGYFNFRYLRKVYMYILCRKLKETVPAKIIRDLYKIYKEGFYVYAPKEQMTDISHMVSYISRYVSHPPISENRITEINEENNTVTYYYTPHETEFIKKLIIHIPEEGFKQIRYYGLYACAYKKRKKIHITERKTWRSRIFRDFHIDPLLCSCGHYMKIDYRSSYFP